MSIETKGWYGGEGSLAEAMFDRLWGLGNGPMTMSPDVTEGPLTCLENTSQTPSGYAKTARVIGSDNNFESPIAPGSLRIEQVNTGVGRQNAVNQTPDAARSSVPDEPPTHPTGSPGVGTRGGNALRRLRARGATRDVHPSPAEKLGPVIQTGVPESRVGNLAAYHDQSAWTGSGPQAALHEDYSKIGELLKFAGVPERALGPESLLTKLAAEATRGMVKEADVAYLTRDNVHPLKLLTLLDDGLGGEWRTWEPETIRETIAKTAGVDPSDDVMSKVMAVKIILNRPDLFHDDWQAMEKISVALNDQSPMMGVVEDVPVEWLSNAVAVVQKIAGLGDFGSDVKKYVAARLHDQGYVVAPPLLKFADPDLGKIVDDDDLRKSVLVSYSQALGASDLGGEEDMISQQVSRMIRNHAYVLDRFSESRDQVS